MQSRKAAHDQGMRAAMAKLVAPRAQRTGQSRWTRLNAARGEAPIAACEEPQALMMDKDMEPS